MVENGLVDEVKKLREMGLSMANISMQGIGYKEIIEYLDGEVSLETAIENIKQKYKAYGKKAGDWFKRERM